MIFALLSKNIHI